MVRGYQKRVIHLKNVGSRLYDEAYFIVSAAAEATTSERDFIKEANRIIKENINNTDGGAVSRFKRRVKRVVLPFVIGAIIGSVLCILITIIYK